MKKGNRTIKWNNKTTVTTTLKDLKAHLDLRFRPLKRCNWTPFSTRVFQNNFIVFLFLDYYITLLYLLWFSCMLNLKRNLVIPLSYILPLLKLFKKIRRCLQQLLHFHSKSKFLHHHPLLLSLWILKYLIKVSNFKGIKFRNSQIFLKQIFCEY